MKIQKFETEHFFAQYEFNTPYQLCNSDCETMSLTELLELADVPLDELGRLSLGYTESQGNPNFRNALAESYPSTEPDNFLILGTPVEGIYLVARALLEPEDEVIVLSPAYDALVNMFTHIVGSKNVKVWQMEPLVGDWQLQINKLQQLITNRTKLVVVNFPHNPTGYLPSPGFQNELIRIVEQNDTWLFCDEMYSEMVLPGTQPIGSAISLSKRSIVLSGLSKTYGLPGLRAGWLVVRDAELYDNIMNWKYYTSICPPGPVEFLASVAWKVRERLKERSLKQVAKNLRLAESFFSRWPELFVWRCPKAGSTALVEMNVPSVFEFATQMAEESGVLILPGKCLAASDNFFRMGFGRAAFPEALDQFENYLRTRF